MVKLYTRVTNLFNKLPYIAFENHSIATCENLTNSQKKFVYRLENTNIKYDLKYVNIDNLLKKNLIIKESTVPKKEKLDKSFSIKYEKLSSEFEKLFFIYSKDKIVEVVINHIIHKDPSFVYVYDVIYSNGKTFKKTFSDFKNRVTETNKNNLQQEDKIFLLCVFCLTNLGLSIEEFNNRQLTYITLLNLIDKKCQTISNTLGIEFNMYSSLENKINFFNGNKQNENLFTFRVVDGISLRKEMQQVSINDKKINFKNLIKKIKTVFDIESNYNEVHLIVPELIKKIANSNIKLNQFYTNFEFLNKIILEDLLEIIKADIVMTRGFRSLSLWKKNIISKSYQEISDFDSSHYFCHVVQRKDLYKQPIKGRILALISSRMVYNSWHYTPGHFINLLKMRRNYYTPPYLPDISFNDDLLHVGHKKAQVKHSIRYPGSLTINKINFHGLFDIRVMRQTNEEFTVSDLLVVKEYVKIFNIIYMESIKYDADKFKITSFSKDWYKSYE